MDQVPSNYVRISGLHERKARKAKSKAESMAVALPPSSLLVHQLLAVGSNASAVDALVEQFVCPATLTALGQSGMEKMLNQVAPGGLSPLYVAAANGMLAAVTRLLEYGADVNLAPWHHAEWRGKKRRPLLPFRDHTGNIYVGPSQQRVANKEILNAEYFPEIVLAIPKDTPLRIAVEHCEVGIVEQLLKAGADPLDNSEVEPELFSIFADPPKKYEVKFNGDWKPYSDENQALLASSDGPVVSLTILRYSYTIDLEKLTQTNNLTERVRPIRIAFEAPTPSTVRYRPLLLDAVCSAPTEIVMMLLKNATPSRIKSILGIRVVASLYLVACTRRNMPLMLWFVESNLLDNYTAFQSTGLVSKPPHPSQFSTDLNDSTWAKETAKEREVARNTRQVRRGKGERRERREKAGRGETEDER